jgi:hypothetical protein
MTSATTSQPGARAGARRKLTAMARSCFASVMLVIIGCFNLIWSLTIIAADMVAMYGLCAYGSRANRTA